jgi:hypothetical protein
VLPDGLDFLTGHVRHACHSSFDLRINTCHVFKSKILQKHAPNHNRYEAEAIKNFKCSSILSEYCFEISYKQLLQNEIFFSQRKKERNFYSISCTVYITLARLEGTRISTCNEYYYKILLIFLSNYGNKTHGRTDEDV